MNPKDDLYSQYADLFNELKLDFDDYEFKLDDFELNLKRQLIQINNKFDICQIFHKNNMEYTVQIWKFQDNIISLNKSSPFFRNIKYLGFFKHPSILNFLGFCPIDFNGNNLPLIFTESTPNGSLYNFLNNEEDHPSKLNYAKKLIIIYGIASAINEVHKHRIIHRNISSKSILLDENLYPKLFYFSHSIKFNKKKHELVGDINYISPEILNEKGTYTPKSDVYAFGILVLEIITGLKPNFYYDYVLNIPDKIRSQIPDCCMNLIQRCCSNIPEERPTFSDIVKNLLSGSFFELLKTRKTRKKYYEYINSLDKIYGQEQDITKYSQISIIKSEPNYEIYKIQEKQEFIENMKIEEESLKLLLSAKSYNKNDEYNKLIELTNILSSFDHPSLLKFYGYSLFDFQYQRRLTFLYEYAKNNSLDNILTLEKEGRPPTGWNFTKKLINIYGIASGMKYLIQKKYVHRSLSTFTILEDENFYPKISHLDYIINREDSIDHSDNYIHRPEYLDPAIIKDALCYNEFSDVYAFSIIMYEILTNEKPFSDYQTPEQIYKDTKRGKRPEFNKQIPQCYEKLIRSCWDRDDFRRPSFSNIVNELERNQEFLTDEVDVKEYKEYIKMIDEKFKLKYRDFYAESNKIKQINVNDFEYIKCVQRDFCSTINEIQEKTTKKIFIAKISIDEIGDNDNYYINKFILKDAKILDRLPFYPSIIKFVGFSTIDFYGYNKPVIVYEKYNQDIIYLNRFIKQKRKEYPPDPKWNLVKKMTCIYGIAHLIKHLYLYGIYIKNPSLSNFKIDEFLYLKFDSFLFCKETKSDIDTNELEKTDVFRFSLMMYEILTNEKPYERYLVSPSNIIDTEKSEYRPSFNVLVPKCYIELIEKCWSHDLSERPSFNEIVEALTKSTFSDILDSEDQIEEYYSYIFSIESSLQDLKYCLNIFDFKLINKINKRYNSNTYVIEEKSTKKLYSAKSFKLNEEEMGDEYKKQIELVKTLSTFDYTSILKYYGYSLFNFKFQRRLTIINEYASNNTLENVLELEKIDQCPDEWDFTKKLINIYGIASGMKYLHSKNILHRNLSTSNILEDDNFYPKITGFNEILNIIESKNQKSNNFIGSSRYASPEVIKNSIYSKASDVYAFAIIMYEIITNEKPFSEFKSDFELFEAVKKDYRPKIKSPFPNCYKYLIESCWSKDPKKRPTFTSIINNLKRNHDFIFEEIDRDKYRDYIKMIDLLNETKEKPSEKTIEQQSDEMLEQESNEINYIDLNDYEKLDKIGSGSFCNVFKIKEKNTQKFFAAKIYKDERVEISDEDNIMISRELNILNKLKHPAILRIKGFSPTNFNNKLKPTYIFELGKCSLYDILELERKGLSPKEWNLTKKLINIYGIALGMKYIHSKNIIHRDIKPDNILEDEYMFPKICDFGLSKVLHQHFDTQTFQSNEGLKGTPIYMAPEALQSNIYTKKYDVYSFGIMFYEIITGEQAYKDSSPYQLFSFIIKGERPSFNNFVPESFKELIKACWSQEPEKRPTFSQIVDTLKTDKFLDNIENKDEFYDYVDYVENLRNKPQDFNFQKVESEIKMKKVIHDINVPSDINQVDLNNYNKLEKIGQGGFARVYKVINKKSKKKFAAKILRDEITDLDEKDQIDFNRELEIISKLQHKSIMKLIGYSEKNFKNKPKPVIISEIVPNGSLSDIMKLENRGYAAKGWDDTKKLINIYGIACGMKYMHSKSFIHRDLKPENILLDEHLFPKISDFGLSKILTPKICEIKSFIKGTPVYIAPEIWNEYEYSKASDVYAFAMIVYEILTNERALIELKEYLQIFIEVTTHQYRPKFKVPIPQCYQKLIESCWSQDPKKRPTFENIVNIIKSDPEFITETIDYDAFIQYTDYIDEFYLSDENQPSEREEHKSDIKLNTYNVTDAKQKINEGTINVFNRAIETEMKTNYFLDLNDYEQKELIRKGEFSKVFKVVHKYSGKIYSARLSNIDMNQVTEEEMKNIAREFNQISQLNHHAILQFIGFSPHDFKNEPKPIVVTEMSSHKTLEKILNMERSNITIPNWNSTKKLMNIYGIASAMKYLHLNHVVHRNLKPSNIVMTDSLLPKISEFGICTHLLIQNSMTFQTSSKLTAPPVYSAPEMLISAECTEASDVFSFAMIVYEILTKEKPIIMNNYGSGYFADIVTQNIRPKIKCSIPDCYKNLIEYGWSENPSERPSFEQIVDMLEKDPEFISFDINEKEYFDYIKIVKENEHH